MSKIMFKTLELSRMRLDSEWMGVLELVIAFSFRFPPE
jgi:hypothetical protein